MNYVSLLELGTLLWPVPNEVPLLVITVEIDLEVKIASKLPKCSISGRIRTGLHN